MFYTFRPLHLHAHTHKKAKIDKSKNPSKPRETQKTQINPKNPLGFTHTHPQMPYYCNPTLPQKTFKVPKFQFSPKKGITYQLLPKSALNSLKRAKESLFCILDTLHSYLHPHIHALSHTHAHTTKNTSTLLSYFFLLYTLYLFLYTLLIPSYPLYLFLPSYLI